MRIGLTVDNKRVNLFDDEPLHINRKAKDLVDLDATFTDYSKPFTVPADDVNNEIFDHWYNADIDVPFPVIVGAVAQITMDGLVVFTGIVELLSVSIVNLQPSSYELVFYGQGKSLNAEFGEYTLLSLIHI